MLIVGERINATRKRIGRAVGEQDAEFIGREAVRQVEAGAGMVDVNGGVPGREEEYLPWLVSVVQDAVDVPLCLDSANPEALALALPLCKNRPMINSVTAEPERLEAVLPLVSEHNTKIIALCLTGSGVPSGVTDRVETASGLIEQITGTGVPQENIYVDPCVFPIGTDTTQGPAILEAIAQISASFPQVHTIGGISNVSFGLPVRKLLNETFLTLAMARGLDAAIIDPTNRQMMAAVTASQALLGNDDYCAEYLQAYRAGKLEPPAAPAKQ